MTKLAVYDKHYGKNDRKITSHYRHGYVYKKNLSMRMGVLLGMLIIIGMRFFYNMLLNEANFFSMLTKEFALKEAVKIVAVLVIYTVICTIKYRREFDAADHRMEDYEARLERLYGSESAERNTDE